MCVEQERDVRVYNRDGSLDSDAAGERIPFRGRQKEQSAGDSCAITRVMRISIKHWLFTRLFIISTLTFTQMLFYENRRFCIRTSLIMRDSLA